MGKVKKRQSLRHSNHHDNPNRAKKAVIRRQHSQNAPNKNRTSMIGKLDQVKTRPLSINGTQRSELKVPFMKWDRILLVGEGDFSFALSLASNHAVGSIVATCFDSQAVLEDKYPNTKRTIHKLTSHAENSNGEERRSQIETTKLPHGDELWNGFSSDEQSEHDEGHLRDKADPEKTFGTTVLYGIDATKLSSVHKKVLRPYSPFTKIVFNFPHTGGLSTDVNRQVRANQQLLVNFFDAAKPMLATDTAPAKALPHELDEGDSVYTSDDEDQQSNHMKHGQILVTLFEGEPYTLWNVRDLARHSGLKLLESFKFPWLRYPGYQHARTVGDITNGKDLSIEGKRKGAWRGEEREARCYVFALKDDDDGRPAPGSRKQKNVTSDSD